MIFWLVAPIYCTKYAYDQQIHDRVDGMWKIHETRVKRGLGGTVNSNGVYTSDQHRQDAGTQINNGFTIDPTQITEGRLMTPFFDNQFHRWNDSIDKNPSNHDDIERHTLYEVDNFERMKPYRMKESESEGNTTVIPQDDDDAKFHFYDNQGESIWTNPPDQNKPLIDHGLDEINVWNFRQTTYNQDAVVNQHSKDPFSALKDNHVPYWGLKLSTPQFYSHEKMQKFYKQWDQKLGLEIIKARQAVELIPMNQAQAEAHKNEIKGYIAQVKEANDQDAFKDVYVTDHKKQAGKFLTHSEDEDEAFFNYKQKLAAYKAQAPKPVVAAPKRKYEVGSLAQRIFDPLAGAKKDEHGTIVYNAQDKEFAYFMKEEKLRAQFEQYTNQEPIDSSLEEEDDELRVIMMEELNQNDQTEEDYAAFLDRELSIFKEGAKYDYVKDLQEAHQDGLATPLANKILKTVPEHYFWDIKVPLEERSQAHHNPYNPARSVYGANFFDIRAQRAYFKEREEQKKFGAPCKSDHALF